MMVVEGRIARLSVAGRILGSASAGKQTRQRRPVNYKAACFCMKPGSRQAASKPIAKTHSLGMSRVPLASRAYARSIQGRINPTADDDDTSGDRLCIRS